MIRITVPLSMLLLVAGHAAAQTQSPPMTGAMAGGCDPNAVVWAIGQEPATNVVEQARRQSGASEIQVLRPGQPAYWEPNPDRLSLVTNQDGAIVRVLCD